MRVLDRPRDVGRSERCSQSPGGQDSDDMTCADSHANVGAYPALPLILCGPFLPESPTCRPNGRLERAATAAARVCSLQILRRTTNDRHDDAWFGAAFVRFTKLKSAPSRRSRERCRSYKLKDRSREESGEIVQALQPGFRKPKSGSWQDDSHSLARNGQSPVDVSLIVILVAGRLTCDVLVCAPQPVPQTGILSRFFYRCSFSFWGNYARVYPLHLRRAAKASRILADNDRTSFAQ